ncbi:MAG: hypothetical protein HQK84_11500, partial [Nitrospinae bacterium]|nr:hypothetical protein [Nitrospinota bacterium]
VVSLIDSEESKKFHSEIANIKSELTMVTGAFQPFAFNKKSVNELKTLIKRGVKVKIYSGPDIVRENHTNEIEDFIGENIENNQLELYKLPERPYIHFRIYDNKYLTFEAPHDEADVIRVKFEYSKDSQIKKAISIFEEVILDISKRSKPVSSLGDYSYPEFSELYEAENVCSLLC